jgi:hypothetical protein
VAATPHGQRLFFAEFLAATGVFERWVSNCPLSYRSGNAPDKRDVLGTLMLGLLAGHRRYAHITALRGDAVAAQALGMAKVISEDTLSLHGCSSRRYMGGPSTSPCSHLETVLRDSPGMRAIWRSDFLPRLCIRRILPIMSKVITPSPLLHKKAAG